MLISYKLLVYANLSYTTLIISGPVLARQFLLLADGSLKQRFSTDGPRTVSDHFLSLW
jgi:hypothetical protein